MRLLARLAVVGAGSLILSIAVVAPPASATTIDPGAPTSVSALLNDLRSAPPVKVAYDRARFFEGQDLDEDGCDTRQEVLLEESLVTPAVIDTCTVTSGEWLSYYDGAMLTDAAAVALDHLVPLKEAWASGAYGWSDAQRTAYANDTDFSPTLTIVSAEAGAAKSDSDPAKWLPPSITAHCRYVTEWVLVKWRWNLAVDPAERLAAQGVLDGCGAIELSAPPSPAIGRPTDPRSGGVTEIAPFAGTTTRLAGADRYQTAIQVSQRYAPNVPAVFVAAGTNFPDALSAAAAATLVGGPLLITRPTSMPAPVLSEIRRLAPKTIYVIGGTGSVSSAVMDTLETIAPAVRLSGADRYATGRAIVGSLFASSSVVFLASGAGFPDALAATGAAGSNGAPVLLVRGTSAALDQATIDTIAGLGATRVVIAGGTGAISPGIASQLTGLGYSVTRYGGASRYDTAALINSAFFPAGSSTHMLIAAGTNFPDALAGAAMAGRLGAPLYITTAACTPESVHDSIDTLGASRLVVMGGTAVVSDAAAGNTGCLRAGTPTISGSARVNSTLSADVGTWTLGTNFTFAWYADGNRITGAGGPSLAVTDRLAGTRISVRVTGTKSGWLTAARTSPSTAVVGYPSRTSPLDSWSCPTWAPIKGNHSSSGEWIYHVPGGQFYAATNPEECFRTESAAVAAGYRKSKR